METYLDIAMIVLSIALIIVIILQSRGAGLGGLSGGDFGGGGFHVRRGIEKLLYNVTILLSVIFFLLAIINVMLAN